MASAKGMHSLPPRLHVTGDDNEPDATILRSFEDEGFDVTYFPYNGGGKPYREKLANLANDLELGESYAIVGMCLTHGKIDQH